MTAPRRFLLHGVPGDGQIVEARGQYCDVPERGDPFFLTVYDLTDPAQATPVGPRPGSVTT